MIRYSLFTVSFVSSFCFLLLFQGKNVAAQGADKTPPSVRVETVGTLSASQPKNYVGIVTAKETVALVPRVSGFLERVAFREGSTVKKGDLLFEIEDTIYAMNVKVVESVVRQIKAEVELAQKELDRINTLHSGRVATEQELDEASRTRDFHQAKLDEAMANLALAENDLSYTKIYAPLTGRIGAKQFSEGNYITPTVGFLASIVQYDPISVKITLSETDFMRYFHGNNDDTAGAIIEIFRTDGHPYEGGFSVDFFDNLVDRETGTIATYLICKNEDAQLLPGGFAKVRLAEKFKEPLPAISVASVMTDGVRQYVFVLVEGNRIERRDIVLGQQVFDRYAVASGLTPGEQIVVGGANKIVPGMEVIPVLPKTANLQSKKL